MSWTPKGGCFETGRKDFGTGRLGDGGSGTPDCEELKQGNGEVES